MQYKDRAVIYKEEKVADGYGGYIMQEEILCEIQKIIHKDEWLLDTGNEKK